MGVYLMVIFAGHPRFFLGSDSAPHPADAKSTSTPTQGCAAGVYTSPILLPLVADLLESFGALDKLNGFVSDYGRAFYKRPAASGRKVVLQKDAGSPHTIPQAYGSDDAEVSPFWAQKELHWAIQENA